MKTVKSLTFLCVLLAASTPLVAATYTTAISETWVYEPNQGVDIYTRVLQPDPAVYPDQLFPAVIWVPGGTGDGGPAVDRLDYRQLARQGFIVIAFNPPGRGSGEAGNLVSGGNEDYNGFAGQDALKAVVEYTAGLPAVDVGNLGVQTNSYGITLGAGTVGRHPLLPVAWLVDMEGPSNSLVTACYYCDTERGLGGHLSTVSDPSAENVQWWSERESFRFIGGFRGAYLRAQAWDDHVQPPGFVEHALEMNNQAVVGNVPWVRIGGSDLGNPVNTLYDDTEPLWLAGRMADYPGLAISYIVEMARMFGADVTPDWTAAPATPHDVDRLPSGTTLITSGHGRSQVIEVSPAGEVVALYRGQLDFAHNADRRLDGKTVISDTGADRVIEIDDDNVVIWDSEWVTLSDGSVLDYPNDANWLEGERLLVTDRDNHRVIEIDRTGQILWQFGETGIEGADATHLNGPHNADRLESGNTLIADSNNDRILEVTAEGEVVWSWQPAGAYALDWPRDADRLVNGATLVTDSRNHRVLEVDPQGGVVWEYGGLGQPYDADRLESGNTLIADSANNRVVEVDVAGTIVWQYPPLTQPDRSSPFGFHPAVVNVPGYPDNGFVDAERIGVRWRRPGVYAMWFLIQPDLEQPSYDFRLHDRQYGGVPDGINILANICPENPRHPEGTTVPGSYLPVDEEQYRTFVRATVERYDGDGVDDMPDLTNPVHFWQVGNEPGSGHTGFARLQQLTYTAVKDACGECTVLIGGVAGFPENYVSSFDTVYGPILDELAGAGFDVFDFHWYGTADGDYRMRDAVTGEDVVEHIRGTLAATGFSLDLPLWITEMGSYSGDPIGPNLDFQSERQQAADYFKRFVYSLARGIEKVFPAFGLMEGFKHDDGYFDHTGLIYDGLHSNDLGLGVKKLAYFTYRKMTDMLEGADWSTARLSRDGTDDDWLYLVTVSKGGAALHIAWWDAFNDPAGGASRQLELTGLEGQTVRVTAVAPSAATGAEVEQYSSAFAVRTYPVHAGTASVPLGEDPVIIESVGVAAPRHASGRAGW